MATDLYPANTGKSPNAVSMLAHRRRRWPNIETALGECPVFSGMVRVRKLCKLIYVNSSISSCHTLYTIPTIL